MPNFGETLVKPVAETSEEKAKILAGDLELAPLLGEEGEIKKTEEEKISPSAVTTETPQAVAEQAEVRVAGDAVAADVLAEQIKSGEVGGKKSDTGTEGVVVETGRNLKRIETIDDLVEGMEVMVGDGYGGVVNGILVGILDGKSIRSDDSNHYAQFNFLSEKRDGNGVYFFDKRFVSMVLEDPKTMDSLKQWNNVPESPWNRYSVSQEVKIPRTSGAVTLAKIVSFNQNGTIFVRWAENGKEITKTLPVSAIDGLNRDLK